MCDTGIPFTDGWIMGLEPTTFGTTIRRSNQLSYIHHVRCIFLKCGCKDNTIFVYVQELGKKIKRFLLPVFDDGGRDAVAALDKFAHREDAAQVDIVVEQQDVGILAALQ